MADLSNNQRPEERADAIAENGVASKAKDLGRDFLDMAHSAFQPRSQEDERESALTDYMPAIEAARRRRGRHSSRRLFVVLCLFFLAMVIWAALADLEETVVGMGQVIPSQRVQHIQNLEGGILGEILVKEGQQVDKGDLLLRIDNEQAGSIYRDAMSRSQELQATSARLKAEINGGEAIYPEELKTQAPEIVARHEVLLQARRKKDDNERHTLEAQLDLRKLEEQELLARRESLAESLEIASRQRDMAKKLMQSRSYSEMDYLNLAQQVTQLQGESNILDNTIPKIRAAIREAEQKLLLHRSEAQARCLQELNTAEAELSTLREALVAGADRVTRTEVRSPVRGVIKSINITTAGGVIMPGEVIMDVVPLDDSLIIEARVSPQDIAFLFIGQKAKIRLTAYDFAIYGSLDATLENISADTIEGKQGEIYYLVKLRTKATSLMHNGQNLPILPGMMAQADIITGKKSVLDYLLKPILKAQQAALRER
ncbi:HlyD family type I secretion periplasmic adaptor subunit [Desulfovibrio sp. OttesenSCG-928-M14]|nr:HlyD family type I secretion periplasmic adaptor subunit [Desulfovibrio sp. OttesenSCG-928-M14]